MKKMLAMLLAMMACALPALGEEAQLTQAPEAAEATDQAFTPTDSNILVAPGRIRGRLSERRSVSH